MPSSGGSEVPAPLEVKGIGVYDRVKVVKGDAVYEGLLMPRTEVLGDDYIVIKLDNGYNIGFRLKEVEVQLVSKASPSVVERALQQISRGGLPRVTVLGTGGTIASKVEYKTGAVYPSLTTEDLYESIPELNEIAVINTKTIFNIFSEDMRPEYWTKIAEAVAKEVESGVDGVVIAHGTDTMGYTAAALSFALQGLPIPVALVGAQRSSDRPSSDAALNMMGATAVASRAPFAEVVVVMHENISDDVLAVYRGAKVRKCHTSRRDAFKAVNDKPIAKVIGGRDVVVLASNLKPRGTKEDFVVKPRFDSRAALIKVYPGIPAEALEWVLESGFRGVVIEGTGLGHTPSYVFPSIRKLVDAGIVVAMTSQCLWGRVNMNVYRTGVELLRMGVIPCEDMLPETALVKLMWCLANASSIDEVKRLMLTNIAGEIKPRTEYKAYLEVKGLE